MPESTSTDEISEKLNMFTLPSLKDNQSGWGPNNEPEQYIDLPYQKFSKSDRIGKIADWSQLNNQFDKKNYNKYQPQFSVGNVGQYSYFHEEDESQFTLVDQSKVAKTSYQKKMKHFQNRSNKRQQQQQYQKQLPNVNPKLNKKQNNIEKMKIKKQKTFQGRNDTRNNIQTRLREPSVRVKEDWRVIEEIDFSRLTKLSLPQISDPTDLKICGSLEYYDKSYDRINTKSSSVLKKINRVYHKVTITDDPIIRQLAKTEGNVFATDSIISTLMCCSRSVYPWDIVVSKVGNKIFFDKRDDSNFDLLTVSETSTDPPQDDEKHINSPSSLALESTYINHNLSQQVLRMNEERLVFPEANPFICGVEGEVASVAYRYRKWDLGEGINLVIRSEIDAVTTGPNDERIYLSIKALNEWDPRSNNGMDWRSKLDSQPGAVLAAEIKNNGCKLAKWTICSLLSGAEQIKFGFVSRMNMRATDKHVILLMQQFKPTEFAGQIALNMDNAWGIIRCIIDFLMKQEDGKYIIMKDPNKSIIRIYDIPDNTFSDEEQGDQDDDEEDEEDQ